jgi:H+/Cl- antiporter ClcA
LQTKKNLNQHLRWIFFSLLSGLLSGAAAAVFLLSLEWATNLRLAHPGVVWGLPLAGLAIGLLYHYWGKDVAAGNNLILDEIHDPKKVVPPHMAPFILAGTLVTHLFGGSAGREGTAVQMGASLSDQLSRVFRIEPQERRILLAAGAGAGFGAAIGAPWAGVIFGMEVINVGRLRLFALFECFIASFTGFYLAVALGAPHTRYPSVSPPGWSLENLVLVAVAGAVFGLGARAFTACTHLVEKGAGKIGFPPFKPLIGGLLLVFFFHLEGSHRYAGLGIPYIQEAFAQPASYRDPALKTLFTSLTIGTGFKGGEFIPLVYIGTTLGSALSAALGLPFAFLAALGFAALFGGASNTPIACTIMAMEIFGIRIGPYALVACFMSYYFSAHHGIYKSQRIHGGKHAKIMWSLNWLGSLPGRFFGRS